MITSSFTEHFPRTNCMNCMEVLASTMEEIMEVLASCTGVGATPTWVWVLLVAGWLATFALLLLNWD